ncbi:MAG: hypothetical protein HUU38_21365 [Anaerolineales bacterium]|nr:hypothetical protein [Anaerolineales bacterium]
MGTSPSIIMWINRQWVISLTNGTAALDWGEGMAQDLLSGEFLCYSAEEYGHTLRDEDLTALHASGRVASFTALQVGLYAWPPR